MWPPVPPPATTSRTGACERWVVDSERNVVLRVVSSIDRPPARGRARAKECSIKQPVSQVASPSITRTAAFAGAAAAIVLIADLLSKRIVLDRLGPGGDLDVVTVIPGVLRFVYVRNTGSAFGLFQGSSDVLKILAVVAVAILGVYYARAAAKDALLAVALGLQVGGAIGNISDRFRFGYVIDWIDFPRFPTFNLADSGITIGVVLLVYCLLFRDPGRHVPDGDVADVVRSVADLNELPDKR